ncbi:hypothetical protein [Arthrobacter sp. Z4-13]
MNTLAVVILMLACALSTASGMLQVISNPTRRIPYVDNSSMRSGASSKWLFIGAIALIAVGAFLYSQGSGADSLVEFVMFLLVGVSPVVLIRLLHNRRVAQEDIHPESPSSV